MKLRYTPEARRDLLKIKTYIADVLQSPIAAENVTKNITRHLRRLEDSPRMGLPLRSLFDVDTDLRRLVCGNYIAIFRVENDMVSVYRIFNGRQDYIRILFGLTEIEDV